MACGLCVDACPQVGGNEFDVGLKARKAIYRPFPQSVPSTYVVDKGSCLNFMGFLTEKQRKRLGKVERLKRKKRPDYPPNILVCGHCADTCDVDAIDFDMLPEDVELRVGSVIVAVGFQEFDARKLGNYGYGRFPNVVTSLELERMLNASGVTQGHVIRPSDHKTPRRIVFVQCVGARGDGGRPYCSRFCCMNAVKDSMLLRQHDPEVEDVTVLYTDMRAFGKGFDDFVKRSLEEQSARYMRGRPAKIEQVREDDTLEVFVEDTLGHEQHRVPADLVVLSVAAAPNDGARKLAKALGIEVDRYGFIAREDPAISAVETGREGVYVCGSAVGPQVIPDCVAQASAAAARAQLFLTGERVERKEAPVAPMDLSGPPRVGVLVCHCGVNIGGGARRGGAGPRGPGSAWRRGREDPPLRLLHRRAGRDGRADPRARPQPGGGGRLHPPHPRAGLPRGPGPDRLQPVPAGDGEHPGPVLLGAHPRARRGPGEGASPHPHGRGPGTPPRAAAGVQGAHDAGRPRGGRGHRRHPGRHRPGGAGLPGDARREAGPPGRAPRRPAPQVPVPEHAPGRRGPRGEARPPAAERGPRPPQHRGGERPGLRGQLRGGPRGALRGDAARGRHRPGHRGRPPRPAGRVRLRRAAQRDHQRRARARLLRERVGRADRGRAARPRRRSFCASALARRRAAAPAARGTAAPPPSSRRCCSTSGASTPPSSTATSGRSPAARRRCTARPGAWASSSCACLPTGSPRSSATGAPRPCAATTSC